MSKKKKNQSRCIPLEYLRGYKKERALDVFAKIGGEEVLKASPEDFLYLSNNNLFLDPAYRGPLSSLNRGMIERMDAMSRIMEEDPKSAWHDIISMYAVTQVWGQQKQVYRFDPDFAEELAKTRSLKLYPELLRRLPYSCFYMDLSNIEAFQPFDGIFVQINVTPTDEILINGHRMVDGIYYTWYHGFDETKNPQQENGLTYYVCEKEAVDFPKTLSLSKPEQKKLGPKVLDNRVFLHIRMFFLQALMYLASEKPDIQDKKIRERTGHAAGKQSASAPQEWDVGFRFGTEFRKQKTYERAEEYDPQRSRRSPRPHSRCAHWHLYWTGQGRVVPQLKWLQPTFVGAREKNVATIRNVAK